MIPSAFVFVYIHGEGKGRGEGGRFLASLHQPTNTDMIPFCWYSFRHTHCLSVCRLSIFIVRCSETIFLLLFLSVTHTHTDTKNVQNKKRTPLMTMMMMHKEMMKMKMMMIMIIIMRFEGCPSRPAEFVWVHQLSGYLSFLDIFFPGMPFWFWLSYKQTNKYTNKRS